MLRKILLIVTSVLVFLAFASAQNSVKTDGEREAAPKLYFKKSSKEVPKTRAKTLKSNIVHPQDKKKTLPFTVEYIDAAVADLQVITQEVDAENWMWKVSIANQGKKKSGESVYAFHINQIVTKKTYPFNSTSTVVYQDWKIIPALQPNAQVTVFFDLSKTGTTFGKTKSAAEDLWSDMFGKVGNTTTYYKITTYFVTDLIYEK